MKQNIFFIFLFIGLRCLGQEPPQRLRFTLKDTAGGKIITTADYYYLSSYIYSDKIQKFDTIKRSVRYIDRRSSPYDEDSYYLELGFNIVTYLQINIHYNQQNMKLILYPKYPPCSDDEWPKAEIVFKPGTTLYWSGKIEGNKPVFESEKPPAPLEEEDVRLHKEYLPKYEQYLNSLRLNRELTTKDSIERSNRKPIPPKPVQQPAAPVINAVTVTNNDTLPTYARTIRGKYVIDSAGFICEGLEFLDHKTVVVTGEKECGKPDTVYLNWITKRTINTKEYPPEPRGTFTYGDYRVTSKTCNALVTTVWQIAYSKNDTLLVYPINQENYERYYKSLPIPTIRLIKKMDRDSFSTTKDTFNLKDSIKVIARVSAPRYTYRPCGYHGPFPFKLFYKTGNEWKLFVDEKIYAECDMKPKQIIIADKAEFIFPFIFKPGTYYIEAGTIHPKYGYQTGVITSNIFTVK